MAFSERILFEGSESFVCLSKAVFVDLYFLKIATCVLTRLVRGRIALLHASTP